MENLHEKEQEEFSEEENSQVFWEKIVVAMTIWSMQELAQEF